MTHEVFATSAYNSRPAELYEFRYGDAADDIFLYTSADHDITIDGDTYTSHSIERDRFTDDGDPDDGNTLNLTLPHINDFGNFYRVNQPEKVITVKIRATQLDDPDEQIVAVWSGRITSVSWEYPEMIISCERISTSLKRTGLQLRYQRQCRHCHYDSGCGLDKANYLSTDTISAITNVTQLTVDAAAGFDDGYFNAGIAEIDGIMRLIISHVGDQISLNRNLPGLEVGDSINLYPGCDRSAGTCDSKYSNVENYGGFDFMPGKGPFDGSSLV